MEIQAICPVARAVDVIGDRWSLLIVRAVLEGVRRFGALQRHLGIASNILNDRLRTLMAKGVLEAKQASDGSAHLEYAPTKLGEGLFPVIVTLHQWAETYLYAEGERYAMLIERGSERPIRRLELLRHDGGPLSATNTVVYLPAAGD
ncbi:transcriptional regulator, HxlR family protein [Burkholderia humptydooensis MSMB43]|uniref:Transcriptional regulator, HxlR family protein n=1 Tax=Burkholderia humptydooensis MSMB43 TaxID=441157 RepID=A0ABN0G2C6_9BURK|nr:transcriptional regulator, HxlR family protein [Burkholderia humptydooensis MSMB43]